MANYLGKADYNNALYIVDPQVLSIEGGHTFRTSYRFTSVTNDASKNIYIKTGNYVVAGKAKYLVSENTEIYFYEASVIDVSGNALAYVNYNRNSSNAGSMEVYSDATVDTTGNEILHSYIPVASTGLPLGTSAGSGEQDMFWLLKPNTNYLLVMYNRSGGDASNIGVELLAREEPNYAAL